MIYSENLRDLWPLKREPEYPAHRFEAENNIVGLSRVYQLPEPFDPMLLEIYTCALWGGYTTKYHDPDDWDACLKYKKFKQSPHFTPQPFEDLFHTAWAIKERNSDLKAINFDDSDMGYLKIFLLGVASGFNPDDIDFFINSILQWSEQQNKKYREYSKALFDELALTQPRGVVFSPKAVALIKSQVFLRNNFDLGL